MKKALLPLAALGLALSSTGALAVLEDFMGTDTDKSGMVSWAEFSLLYPDVSEQEFQTADLDDDGELSRDEFDALKAEIAALRAEVAALKAAKATKNPAKGTSTGTVPPQDAAG